MRTRLVLGTCLLLSAACSGKPYKLAPVSGKITLNGKPLANAWVHFAPKSSEDQFNPGPTSHGQTNADGIFTLQLEPNVSGAVVGKHTVFISLVKGGSTAADAGNRRGVERIPRRYNMESILEFDVSTQGTQEANFSLDSP